MLAYEFGADIRDRQGFFDLNRKYFSGYTGKDLDAFNKRIERTVNGIGCAYFSGQPAAVLQTMRMRTCGSAGLVPKTSAELTGNETYLTYDQSGDTLIFVTFAVEESVRHEDVNGKTLTDAVIGEMISHYSDARFKITYSPAMRSAVGMHFRHGAKPVMRLRNARPGLEICEKPAEDVIIMGYEWPVYDLSLLKEFGMRHDAKFQESH